MSYGHNMTQSLPACPPSPFRLPPSSYNSHSPATFLSSAISYAFSVLFVSFCGVIPLPHPHTRSLSDSASSSGLQPARFPVRQHFLPLFFADFFFLACAFCFTSALSLPQPHFLAPPPPTAPSASRLPIRIRIRIHTHSFTLNLLD